MSEVQSSTKNRNRCPKNLLDKSLFIESIGNVTIIGKDSNNKIEVFTEDHQLYSFNEVEIVSLILLDKENHFTKIIESYNNDLLFNENCDKGICYGKSKNDYKVMIFKNQTIDSMKEIGRFTLMYKINQLLNKKENILNNNLKDFIV